MLTRMLVRYPAMSAQVVAKIYAPNAAPEAEGRPLLPPPAGKRPEGVRLSVRTCSPGPSPAQAMRRIDAGRIDVVEDGARRSFGPAESELQATVTVNDPAAWRSLLRGSVGLGEAYVDGLWETDDLVALMRIAARELRHLDGLRGAVARPRGLAHRHPPPRPRKHPRGRPPQHLRPLRPRQRPLLRLPRRADDVLLRVLPRARGRASRRPSSRSSTGSAAGCGSAPTTTCSRSAAAGAGWRSTPPASTAAG